MGRLHRLQCPSKPQSKDGPVDCVAHCPLLIAHPFSAPHLRIRIALHFPCVHVDLRTTCPISASCLRYLALGRRYFVTALQFILPHVSYHNQRRHPHPTRLNPVPIQHIVTSVFQQKKIFVSQSYLFYGNLVCLDLWSWLLIWFLLARVGTHHTALLVFRLPYKPLLVANDPSAV